ncbi:MAG: hypothetical protein ACU83O_01805 [Gammaproteobacteria bacterium]
MLLESYDKQGLLSITSVLGATGEKGVSAFRGDLVLKQGALREGSSADRKPPELVLHQAAILVDSEEAKGFSTKTQTLDFDDALIQTIVVKKEAAVGPV